MDLVCGRRILVVGLLALAAPAAAQAPPPWAVGVSDAEKAEARALLDAGNALLLERKYPEALERYTAAVAVWDHPAIRFNIVRCLIHLDRIVEASDNLDKALAHGAAPLEDSVYQEALSYQKLLANQIGELVVTCKQDGVVLTLDGQPLATCPATTRRRVAPGTHQIVGVKPGLLTRTAEVVVLGGAPHELAITLDPPEAAARVVHRWPGYVPWLAFGAGAALVGVGAVFQVNASSQMESYDKLIDIECTRRCASGEVPAAIEDERRGAERKSAIGVSLLVTGGAGVVAGAVLLYLNRGRTIYPESITPLPGGGAAVTWGGSF
jgi:tetratricopeptide (TPR) repeat protein